MAKIYGDRWETIDQLPEGGQAFTYRVRDIKGGGEVHYVLKRLKNDSRIARFAREIEVVRSLSHPNILRLIDFDLQSNPPYFVTEYCEGGTLAETKSKWEGNYDLIFKIILDVAHGLAEAHVNGIIHRDIKPQNIFLRSSTGPAVIGDFGLCYVDDGELLTVSEEAVGSRHYIAPELENGGSNGLSSKADIYSLGKVLYYLLSGGREYAREAHREERFDLTKLTGNQHLEHANRVLDQMVTSDPNKRGEIGNVLHFFPHLRRLIMDEYVAVGPSMQPRCRFCGQGFYFLRASDSTAVRNFGFNPVGSSKWRIYSCNYCGHVESFRIDGTSMQKEWWRDET